MLQQDFSASDLLKDVAKKPDPDSITGQTSPSQDQPICTCYVHMHVDKHTQAHSHTAVHPQ